jgi:hypothetical protein
VQKIIKSGEIIRKLIRNRDPLFLDPSCGKHRMQKALKSLVFHLEINPSISSPCPNYPELFRKMVVWTQGQKGRIPTVLHPVCN